MNAKPQSALAQWLITATLLWGILACCGSVNAATFTASLDRPTIELGSTATLTLTFQGGEPASMPEISAPGLQFGPAGRSSSVTVVNRAVRQIISYSYNVSGRQIGEFTIPEITVVVNGQQLKAGPLQVKVVQPGSSVMASNGEALAMLKLVLPQRELFVGEVVTAQLEIYLHRTIQNVGDFRITSLPTPGFNVGKSAEGQRSQVTIGQSAYTCIPVSLALTPVKAGTTTIGPITASLAIEVASGNRRQGFVDPFGLFSNNQRHVINLGTEPQSVEVKPLPATQLPAFSGAIGKFTLDFSAGPTNVAVGDPVTVKVRISGRGALDSVTLPDQTDWSEFKVYPSTAKTETTDPLGLEGSRNFEQVIVPLSTSLSEVPEFKFSFFDPETRSFQTLRHPATPLIVRPAGSTPAPTLAQSSQADEAAPAEDLLPIRQRIGTVIAHPAPLLQQPLFVAAQSLPVIAFIAAFLWRQRTDALANNPRLRRQRQVAELLRHGIADLHRQAAANQSDAFFATVFRLLQEQIGVRLDLPASSITESVIEERLRPLGTPEATLAAVHELFQLCNLARYAPIQSSQELTQLVPKVESTLQALREVRS